MAGYRKHEAQEWAWQNLKGQWTTLVTPFTPDNRVDTEGLRSNVRHVQSLGVRGGGCTWNMGEFWSLTEAERRIVMDTVADEAAGHWLIGAHVTDTFPQGKHRVGGSTPRNAGSTSSSSRRPTWSPRPRNRWWISLEKLLTTPTWR